MKSYEITIHPVKYVPASARGLYHRSAKSADEAKRALASYIHSQGYNRYSIDLMIKEMRAKEV